MTAKPEKELIVYSILFFLMPLKFIS